MSLRSIAFSRYGPVSPSHLTFVRLKTLQQPGGSVDEVFDYPSVTNIWNAEIDGITNYLDWWNWWNYQLYGMTKLMEVPLICNDGIDGVTNYLDWWHRWNYQLFSKAHCTSRLEHKHLKHSAITSSCGQTTVLSSVLLKKRKSISTST